VDFAGLLDHQPKGPQIEILRADAVPTIENRGSGCTIRILSPPEDAGVHEVYELRLDAGGVLDSEPHARGTRENLTVFEGCVTVVSGDATAHVGIGETVRYPADVAHRISAEPEAAARAFLVVKAG
jgi:quercetin dioxygenase-like cupin family protein